MHSDGITDVNSVPSCYWTTSNPTRLRSNVHSIETVIYVCMKLQEIATFQRVLADLGMERERERERERGREGGGTELFRVGK